ncbi:MAG: DUF1553 domain-containing protein [Rhodocyclaceae bacterium]|nr:MAG: DUF1553 domain-containing protein [Rhodocyclaceae bacterium]
MKKKTVSIAVAWALTAAIATEALSADIKPAAAESKETKISPTWAYQLVKRPDVPQVKEKSWVRTPIDNFVLTKLEEKGLKPSKDADRAVFIRRITLDVWGIIPTPEEVKAFVADKSPNAYEKLVDRLLDSPKYGERLARRWLDLARYSDSAGFTNDETRPNAWRYRDYVITAFNQDKPYDQFIREQLAGDELYPDNQNALVATGFLRYYPDDSNSRDLVQRKYLTTTDMTDTTGAVFLAQSIDCARCHNHKTDKVSQKEYFQLQAFFANTNADDHIPVKDKGVVERQYEQDYAKWLERSKDTIAKLKEFAKPYLADAEKYNKERFFEDTRVSLFKDKAKWDANDRWVNQRYENLIEGEVGREELVNGYLTYLYESETDKTKKAEYKALVDQYKKLATALKKFDNLKPEKGSTEISAVHELGHPDAPPTHIRFTGIHDKYLDEVQPDFPALYNPAGLKPDIKPSATSSGRRSALANWIASPQNPLTARVLVNRIWEHHFGRGIVATVSDFGKAGERPTNQALLDYLADEFVKNNWSVKKLQREILLSSVYRQSSDYRPDVFKADKENRYLAVFPRQRLEAEQIRDSLLVAAGLLNDKVGGPSVYAPIPAVLTAGGRDLWKEAGDPTDQYRRSLYIFSRRSVPYPMFETFDGASQQAVHSRRDVTTTPLQALTLINNDQVYKWSQNLAGRVYKEGGSSEAAQIERLYQILYARSPDKEEKQAITAYLDKHEKVIKEQVTSGKLAITVPAGLKEVPAVNPLRLAAFVDLAHSLANTNEFSYRN